MAPVARNSTRRGVGYVGTPTAGPSRRLCPSSSWHGVTYYMVSEPPVTFAFQTGKGDLGILQVIRFTEEPAGMRLRYKLVQRPAAAMPDETAPPTVTVAHPIVCEITDYEDYAGLIEPVQTAQKFAPRSRARCGGPCPRWRGGQAERSAHGTRSHAVRRRTGEKDLGGQSGGGPTGRCERETECREEGQRLWRLLGE